MPSRRVVSLPFKVFWTSTSSGWFSLLVVFLEEELELNVGNRNMCVCEACRQSIMYSMKAGKNGEPYQLRWQKNDHLCVVCHLVAQETSRLKKHEFTWDMIRESIGLVSVESPGDISLCTKHNQQVYRMLDAKAHA